MSPPRRKAMADGVSTGIHVPSGGFQEGHPPDPCVMVIFGASGDLAHRQLIPSLYELHGKGLLADRFAVVGFARTEWNSDTFRKRAEQWVDTGTPEGARGWREFCRRMSYVPAPSSQDEEQEYSALAREIERVREEFGIPDNVFFHLAVPPEAFSDIVTRLEAVGLTRSEHGWRRLVIEKPFGEDLESARRLDRQIRNVFREDQIYRIDHFLGKETVQNMLAFRFANSSFEPIWNRNYIDHVQITVAEDLGIGTRAGFYEQTGVVRDMIQNHLLQLLCMTAIEPPLAFDGRSLRDETVKVLQSVNVTPMDLERDVVRGQYGPGTLEGRQLSGYREEEGVAATSDTATYAAIRLTLDNWRWAGVPFYLRTGKRLARRLTEVAIRFKPTPHFMFPRDGGLPTQCNDLVFRLQPKEGIIQTLVGKRPGPRLQLQPVTMTFLYADAFGIQDPPRAYAWLLLDVMEGNQTLFARADWIEEAWKIVDPLVRRWEEEPAPGFPNYEAGSWGPGAAEELLAREGRSWRQD
jgi:glucose-6-phosphate 1-dehydrogenase